jgi:glyoxalase family protein
MRFRDKMLYTARNDRENAMTSAAITQPIAGLHHVTAISGPAQENIDFYAQRLGTRLIKKTVNFDAPEMYHLYYGAPDARPGSVLTFFNRETSARGQAGTGAAQAFAYAVAPEALEEWHTRLGGTRFTRFGETGLALQDPHGQAFEMIATPAQTVWGAFHSATLWVADPEPTARILTDVFGYQPHGQERGPEGARFRFHLPGNAPGRIVDIWHSDIPAKHRPGPGTIHHIAFRARDLAHQQALRDTLLARGEQVTEVKDRQYFKAIYFREPGGVLFEIATDGPGFTVDEPMEHLGAALKLPPQHEHRRAELEASLPALRTDTHHTPKAPLP